MKEEFTIDRVKRLKKDKDYYNLFRYCQYHAKGSNLDAMFNIALMYFNGTGIEKDATLAVRYFEKAAVLGHVRSQFNLGICYHKGWGVSQDLVKSHYWLSQAANQGYHKAGEYLGQLPSYYVLEDLERVSEQLESIEQEIDGPVNVDKILRKIRRTLDQIEEETQNEHE